MTDYKCLDCGEVLEYKHHCVLHANEHKHQNFEIIETELKMTIKI